MELRWLGCRSSLVTKILDNWSNRFLNIIDGYKALEPLRILSSPVRLTPARIPLILTAPGLVGLDLTGPGLLARIYLDLTGLDWWARIFQPTQDLKCI